MPRPKIGAEHPDFPHGTNAGYQRKCRCAGCTNAHAETAKVRYFALRPDDTHPYREHGGNQAHPDFPHGENAGFVAGCRCDACKDAHRVHFRMYSRKARAPGTPGGVKKLAANATFRKSAKGIASSRKGTATRAARVRGAAIGISDMDQAMMRLIYMRCPEGYEVDHKTPLSQGGAHEPANLQYLPLRINRQKSGRLDFEDAAHAIRWQDVLEVPSTIIPQGSRGKRPEAHRALMGS